MREGEHDLGFLKRVDQGDGWSALVDGFGETVATVRTEEVAKCSENFDVKRFRVTVRADS